ncbi:hypothetical protein [Myxococcus sp. NMCA1]|uniref:hypothetical protein n=1 Tax=Myxococcus sp. NMCA1 TaxID=2996785 RepID=UPI0022867A99|nr:hypothetical protein [Myxococcus sp. NMCA1]WAM26893.1 hypothetical protein OZ403_01895 [Myxococcus sp. NMCA1]
MSGGRSARFGFFFSDLVVIRRIIEHLISNRASVIEGRPQSPSPLFQVESAIIPEQAPEWDIVEKQATLERRIVLEEVKSGPLKAPDRETFWKRIRQTASRLDAHERCQIIPRLTTNRDNPTDHEDRWINLRTAVTQITTTPEKSPHFTSTEALATEAIYHLTHTSTEDSSSKTSDKPLSLEQAKCILEAFEFNNSLGANTLEDDIELLIGSLTFKLPTKELLQSLIGTLYQRASAKDPSARQFTADDIHSSLSTLERLGTVNQADARIWHSWSNLTESSPNNDIDTEPKPGLPYQDWHIVQPEISRLLTTTTPRLLALIGRGGLGKSVLLGKLHQHSKESGNIAIWLTGFDLRGKTPQQVGSILELGAFASSFANKPLHIFIDALENSAADNSALPALLASLSDVGSLPNVYITMSVRAVTWGGLAGSQEKLPRWLAAELSDWNEDRVRELISGSRRPSIGGGLLRLLRTPLLLDLFLRTFSGDEAIPTGLQTRHAVLDAYWERRVLPSNNPDSAKSRELLAQFCEREAGGHSRHTFVEPAVHKLASEGVFTQQHGTWSFRHPLIRDFAMAQWAAIDSTSPKNIIKKLAGITDSLSRWGAFRAAIEAAVESSSLGGHMPPLEDLIREVSAESLSTLMSAAEVLGQLEAPSSVNLGSILREISPAESAAEFINRLLDLARLDRNAAWIPWILSLPPSAEWIEATPWIGHQFLHHVIEWVDELSKNWSGSSDAQAATPAKACALRLRNWSAAPKFGAAGSNKNSFNWMKLIPLVSRFLPTQETLDWMLTNARRTMSAQSAILQALPALVVAAERQREELTPGTLVEVFCRTGNLTRTPSGLCEGPPDTAPIQDSFLRTQLALLGHNSERRGHRGLLREAPEVFLPVAFDMLSGFAASRRQKHQSRSTQPDNTATVVYEPETSSAELADIERRIKEAHPPTVREEDIFQDIIDDTEYTGHVTEIAFIINDLENMITEDLDAGGAFAVNTYWPLVQKSHSTTSRLILLEALTGGGRAYPELTDELLTVRALYFISQAHYHIYQALSFRWPYLSVETRQIILANIESVARANWMNGAYAVPPLASAIPLHERPTWLHPYFELFRLQNFDPVPTEPSPPYHDVRFHSSQPQPDDIENLSPWQKVERQRSGQISILGDDFLDRLHDLKTALTTKLPEPAEVIERPTLPYALHTLLESTAWRRVHNVSIPSELTLTSSELIQLLNWSFDILQRCHLDTLSADNTPIKAHGTPSINSLHPWVTTLELAGAIIASPELRDNLIFNQQLFEEIARRTTSNSPALAWHIFRAIEPFHWVREGSAGRELLKSFIFEKIRDPGALVMAFRHTLALGATDACRAFHHWLCEQDALEQNGDLEGFARLAGICLGHCAFPSRNGERSRLRQLTDELLSHPPTQGLLAETHMYREWCLGLTFGAKNEVRRTEPDHQPSVYPDFASLLDLIWQRVRLPIGAAPSTTFATYFLHALTPEPASSDLPLDKHEQQHHTSVRLLWPSLEPIALKIASDGRAGDVFQLVSGILHSNLPAILRAADLLGIVRALHARALNLGTKNLTEFLPYGTGWLEVFDTGTELIMAVSTSQGATSQVRSWLHEVLQAWSNLKVPKAPEMARLLRE